VASEPGFGPKGAGIKQLGTNSNEENWEAHQESKKTPPRRQEGARASQKKPTTKKKCPRSVESSLRTVKLRSYFCYLVTIPVMGTLVWQRTEKMDCIDNLSVARK
jgi:hypothetical protein